MVGRIDASADGQCEHGQRSETPFFVVDAFRGLAPSTAAAAQRQGETEELIRGRIVSWRVIFFGHKGFGASRPGEFSSRRDDNVLLFAMWGGGEFQPEVFDTPEIRAHLLG